MIRVEIPRLDANSETVLVNEVLVVLNQRVSKGEELAHLETLKSSEPLVSPVEGFVRKILIERGQEAATGELAFVLTEELEGSLAEEEGGEAVIEKRGLSAPTLKAQMLALEYKVDLRLIEPADGVRIREQDVLEFLPYHKRPLTGIEAGIQSAIRFAKEEAVSAYLELEVDFRGLVKEAVEYPFISPQERLPSLSAWYFVHCLKAFPRFNSSASGQNIIEYRHIQLGLTVDVEGELFVATLKDADRMERGDFLAEYCAVQQRAKERRGCGVKATVGFTSLAACGVSRHVPVLLPDTSLILAHSAPLGTGATVIGASYDHRVHTGLQVAELLRRFREAVEPS
ncbi:MAG: 2-oxo acid dehydrogenase subunit E2 [Planctomycetes bacterium]|nr:2-oxo acid dehydrogenase subunit E2 [Planctomycetota bacterium]